MEILDLVSRADREWMDRAVCHDSASQNALFSSGEAQRIAAERICPPCPVRAECLGHALEHHEAYGVWGGLTERARRKLMKGRKPRASIS